MIMLPVEKSAWRVKFRPSVEVAYQLAPGVLTCPPANRCQELPISSTDGSKTALPCTVRRKPGSS